jgi:DNA-binding GntR family transcriptional regulator
VGRDRDPFERTIAFVRERVAALPPLQGAVIRINALAKRLDLSETPVREALATLAGEGLIVRASAGYAGATYDPKSLAGQYDLAELLAMRAMRLVDNAPLDLTTASSFEVGLD